MNRWDITDVKNLEFDDNISKKVVEIRCVDTADLPQPRQTGVSAPLHLSSIPGNSTH